MPGRRAASASLPVGHSPFNRQLASASFALQFLFQFLLRGFDLAIPLVR
jgi:hypothetical protein